MAKVLAICIIVCLAVPVFADELQELNQKRNMINVAIIKAQGVAEMNEQQIYEGYQRAIELKATIKQLQDQFSQITRDMRALEAVAEEKPSE